MVNKKNFNQKLITDRSEKSVNLFFDEIRNTTPLSRDEEKRLGRIIQKGGPDAHAAMNKLITSNLKYTVTEAKKYQTGNITFSELLQQANIGAIEAAKRFDPEMDKKFITYLKPWIKQSILYYISEYGRALRLPGNQIALKSKIAKYKAIFFQKNGYNPSVLEISEYLDVSYHKVHFLEMNLKSVVSMDNTLSGESDVTITETIEDVDSLCPSEKLTMDDLSISINRALSKLSVKEREILKLFNGIGYKREYSLDEISKQFSLTSARVRQIKDTALKKMKSIIEENELLS